MGQVWGRGKVDGNLEGRGGEWGGRGDDGWVVEFSKSDVVSDVLHYLEDGAVAIEPNPVPTTALARTERDVARFR